MRTPSRISVRALRQARVRGHPRLLSRAGVGAQRVGLSTLSVPCVPRHGSPTPSHLRSSPFARPPVGPPVGQSLWRANPRRGLHARGPTRGRRVCAGGQRSQGPNHLVRRASHPKCMRAYWGGRLPLCLRPRVRARSAARLRAPSPGCTLGKVCGARSTHNTSGTQSSWLLRALAGQWLDRLC